MNSIDLLKDLARRPLEVLGYFQDRITPEHLNAHPAGHDNSVAWLLWHTAREIDAQVAELAGQEQVWTAQGFDAKFGLDVDPEDHGYAHTPEQARAIVVEDRQLLVDHLSAVIDAELAYLDTLTEADLGEIIDENWDPPVTRGARLVSVSVDAVQHVAQAAYVTGMDV